MKTSIEITTNRHSQWLQRNCEDMAESCVRQIPRIIPGATAIKTEYRIVVSGASAEQLQPLIDAFVQAMGEDGESVRIVMQEIPQ